MCHSGNGGVCTGAQTKRNIMFMLSKMLGKQHITESFIRKLDCSREKSSPNTKHVDDILGKKFLELYFAK